MTTSSQIAFWQRPMKNAMSTFLSGLTALCLLTKLYLWFLLWRVLTLCRSKENEFSSWNVCIFCFIFRCTLSKRTQFTIRHIWFSWWLEIGTKPLPEKVRFSSLTHVWVTRTHYAKGCRANRDWISTISWINSKDHADHHEFNFNIQGLFHLYGTATWINKYPPYCAVWNYLSIPNLQWCNR